MVSDRTNTVQVPTLGKESKLLQKPHLQVTYIQRAPKYNKKGIVNLRSSLLFHGWHKLYYRYTFSLPQAFCFEL